MHRRRNTLPILFLLGVLAFSNTASAHVPLLVEDDAQGPLIEVTEPAVSSSFYGNLTGAPHTFEVRTKEQLRLKVEIAVPDIESAENIISGIIIKETKGGGRVVEVARLPAGSAQWASFYEPFGGDSYRRGPSYDAVVDPGVYRIEVSTPDNMGKYVLSIGYLEENDIGYFETLKRIAGIKEFFGKSQLLVIESPFVYVPLGFIVLIVIFSYAIKRKKMQRHSVL